MSTATMSGVMVQIPSRFPMPGRRRESSVDSARRAESPRLRLTRRGRAVLTTLVAFPLVAGALVFAINSGGAAASGMSAHSTFHYVTVQSGESLWSVAVAVAPSADPRDVIADIVSLNQLQSTAVTPGQRVAIPVQYETKH